MRRCLPVPAQILGCCAVLVRQESFSRPACSLLICLQHASSTVVEDAVTAVEDVVERLPDDFDLQQNAVKAVEVVEEIVSPHQLAQKRLKRKQQKARLALHILTFLACALCSCRPIAG